MEVDLIDIHKGDVKSHMRKLRYVATLPKCTVRRYCTWTDVQLPVVKLLDALLSGQLTMMVVMVVMMIVMLIYIICDHY